ncbi:MAG TPA: hypothetical protein VKV06_09105 [Acidimicrobiales bacterium]|nr:hypothetical protein [Acidimicrobiales bacterium]
MAAGVGLAAALLAGCGTAGGVKDPGSAVRVGSPTGHSPAGHSPAGHSRALAPATALRRSEARQPGVPAGCALPKLPVAGAGPKRDFPMTGPAVRDLRGGADRHRFSLDGGGLVVAPPGAGSAPAVSRRDAECAALASTNASGFGFEDMAKQAGVALGYGQVSIRGGLRLETPPADNDRPVATEPTGTPVGPRLSWIAVFDWDEPTSCPAMTVRHGSEKAPKTAGAAHRTSYDYQAVIIDAHTGDTAWIYTEGRPSACGGTGWQQPTISPVTEVYSVPWRLVSRRANGSSARIRATIPACDTYDPWAQATKAGKVEVAVDGPLAARGQVCRPLESLPITVDPPAGGLPARLVHGPTGPVLQWPNPFDGGQPSNHCPMSIGRCYIIPQPVPASGPTPTTTAVPGTTVPPPPTSTTVPRSTTTASTSTTAPPAPGG